MVAERTATGGCSPRGGTFSPQGAFANMSTSTDTPAASLPSTAEGEAQHEHEESSVKNATRLSARLIYEVIRRDGEEELTRPTASLIWSGIAAGVLISLSVLGEAIFRANMADT